MTFELCTYERPDLGFALDLPAASELLEGVQGTVVVAVEPAENPLAFRANLNVVVERLEPGLGFDVYLERSLAAEADALRAFQLIDRAPVELGGAPGLRTLAHHQVGEHAVALEQWRAPVGELGYVISGSCAALDFDELADTFAVCAESFRLLEPPE